MTHPNLNLPANCALYIAEGLSMSGRIELKDARPVVIAGTFDGEIEIAGELVVEPTARISHGPVRAGQLTLEGRMSEVSMTEVAELLDVRAGGVLQGDRVRYAELVLARGAQINASLEATTQPAGLAQSVHAPTSIRPVAVALAAVDAQRATISAPAGTPPVLTDVAAGATTPGLSTSTLEDLTDLSIGGEPRSPFDLDELRPRFAAN